MLALQNFLKVWSRKDLKNVFLYRNDGKITFDGTGVLRINKSGIIKGRILVKGSKWKEMHSIDGKTGQLIPHDKMYYFQAETRDGLIYSENVYPKIKERFSDTEVSMTISFYCLRQDNLAEVDFLGTTTDIGLWDKYHVPLVAKNEKKKYRKVIKDYNKKNGLYIGDKNENITLKNCYDGIKNIRHFCMIPNLDRVMKIKESLYVLTGVVPQVAWAEACSGRRVQTRIWSRHTDRKLRAYPIIYNNSLERDGEYELFYKYFQFVCKINNPNWHELTDLQHSADHMSAQSNKSAALLLCSAIERIVMEYYNKVKVKTVPAAIINKVNQTIDNAKIQKNLKIRCRSIIGSSLGKVRPIDKLYALERKGVVPCGYSKKWTDIRNPIAHGNIHDSGINQKDLDDLYVIYDIFHSLIAGIVGYKAKRTYYSLCDWPLR